MVAWKVKLPEAGRIDVIRHERWGRRGYVWADGGVGRLLCIIKRFFPSWGFSARSLHITFLVCFHLNSFLAWDTWKGSFPSPLNKSRLKKGVLFNFLSEHPPFRWKYSPIALKNVQPSTHLQQLLICAGRSGGLSDIFSQYTLGGLCSSAEV